MSENPKYIIGEHIICLTLPESCLIVDVNELSERYTVHWVMRPSDGFDDSALSFYAAHKYFKQIDLIEKGDLQWQDTKLATS